MVKSNDKYVTPPEVAEIVGRIYPAAVSLGFMRDGAGSVHQDQVCLGRIQLLCYAVRQEKNRTRFCYPLALQAVRDNLAQIADDEVAKAARWEARAAGLYSGGGA